MEGLLKMKALSFNKKTGWKPKVNLENGISLFVDSLKGK